MISEFLLSALLLLSTAIADTFQPTPGERIPGNVTYSMTWSFNIPYGQCGGITFFLADMEPPDYTTAITVDSREHNLKS
jgi:hypothetical protein